MATRSKLSRGKSKKIWKKSAGKTNVKNAPTRRPQRGGMRL